MMEEISIKNSKNEILDAYYELLEQIKQIKKPNKQEEKIIADRKSTVSEAVKHSPDDLIQGLANLETNVFSFEAQIVQITKRTNQSNLQVQDIAIKAMDGTARNRYVQLEKAEVTKANN